MTKAETIDWAWGEIKRALIDGDMEPDPPRDLSETERVDWIAESWSQTEEAVREILADAIPEDGT